MLEDTFHDIGVIDERNDAHGGAAVGALQRTNLVNLLNQSGPVGLFLKPHLWSGLSLYRIAEQRYEVGRSRQVATLSLAQARYEAQGKCNTGDPSAADKDTKVLS